MRHSSLVSFLNGELEASELWRQIEPWMHYSNGGICRKAAFKLLPLRSVRSAAKIHNLDGIGMRG